MRLVIVILSVTLAVAGLASAQAFVKEWPSPTPGPHFPKFFSSDEDHDFLLNSFFARHWYALPDPTSRQTLTQEWNALSIAWVDTHRNDSSGRDYNAGLRNALLTVQLDAEGYVFSYSPSSGCRNRLGGPFPNCNQSGGAARAWDWAAPEVGQDGWTLIGGGTTNLGVNGLWNTVLTEPDSCIEIKDLSIDSFQSPYLIVGFAVSQGGTAAVEWTTDSSPEWSAKNRVEFAVPSGAYPTDYYLPVYRHSGWSGKITGLRLRPLAKVPEDGIDVVLDRVECAYDTRQPINNMAFILASRRYYLWTGDDDFLRRNIGRLRAAAHYLRSNLKGDADGMVTIPYLGHDGTSGIAPKRRAGCGIGSDYWDLLPMGHKSVYTNAYYAASLRAMADLEDAAIKLRVVPNPFGEDADSFRKQAKSVASKSGKFFWDDKAGRFIGCEDADGKRHDYGFVYLNLESLYYGLGDAEKASSIYSWLDGARTVEGDTSAGKDIYRWRFAPRATTKRNTDWYIWLWDDPKKTPWGDNPQDGGSVAYVSFYDVMNRIRYKDPDDAYSRLKDVLSWYAEVWADGGYRDYYSRSGRGILAGGGRPGGLGIDADFAETALVPLSFLYGFLGIDATPEGLTIEPKLPKDLTYAGVRGLTYHGVELTITAERGKITVKCTRNRENRSFTLSGRKVSGTFERTVDAGLAVLKAVD